MTDTAITIPEFKSIVDQVLAGTVQIDDSNFENRLNWQQLFDQIRTCFPENAEEQFHFLRSCTKAFTFDLEFSKEPLSDHLRITRIIEDAIRHPLPGNSDPVNWLKAITLAYEHGQSSIYYGSQPFEMIEDWRGIFLAKAATWLDQNGFPVLNENSVPACSAETSKKITESLDAHCMRIGGQSIFRRILSEIRNCYDAKFGRFHLTRQFAPYSIKPPAAQIPWNFLLQLAGKHLNSQGTPNKESDWEFLKSLTANAMALSAVQPLTRFDHMTLGPSNINDFLFSTTYYDTWFCRQQIRAKDLILMARGILGPLQVSGPTFTLDEVITVLEAAIETTDDCEPTTFTSSQIAAKSLLGESLVRSILNDVFSQSSDSTNESLCFPPLISQTNLAAKPIVRIGKTGEYFLPSRALFSQDLFEALLSWLRTLSIPELENKIGNLAEDFLRQKLTDHFIDSLTGTYRCPKNKEGIANTGECDIVVEAQDKIVFMELKKKSLTSSARTGTHVNIVNDLALSLLNSHCQMQKHQYNLIEHKNLILTKDNVTFLLLKNNRSFMKVSLTLLDYGSLQCSPCIQKYLSLCVYGVFASNNAEEQEFLNQAQKKSKDLGRMAMKLGDATDKLPFIDSKFLSIPLLLIMLDSVNSAEDLVSELSRNRHVLFLSADLYYEYSLLLKIEQETKS